MLVYCFFRFLPALIVRGDYYNDMVYYGIFSALLAGLVAILGVVAFFVSRDLKEWEERKREKRRHEEETKISENQVRKK